MSPVTENADIIPKADAEMTLKRAAHPLRVAKAAAAGDGLEGHPFTQQSTGMIDADTFDELRRRGLEVPVELP